MIRAPTGFTAYGLCLDLAAYVRTLVATYACREKGEGGGVGGDPYISKRILKTTTVVIKAF